MSGDCPSCNEHPIDCSCFSAATEGENMSESMEKSIYEMFESSCRNIVDKNLAHPEFEFCKQSIMVTIEWLEMKRSEERDFSGTITL